MPSYPIRPTFPVDVRSPTGTVSVRRSGTALLLDANAAEGMSLPPSSFQFFAALDATYPGASSTVMAAVPADPNDAVNRAYRGTSFVTPGCALVTFVRTVLSLTEQQASDVLALAALQPK